MTNIFIKPNFDWINQGFTVCLKLSAQVAQPWLMVCPLHNTSNNVFPNAWDAYFGRHVMWWSVFFTHQAQGHWADDLVGLKEDFKPTLTFECENCGSCSPLFKFPGTVFSCEIINTLFKALRQSTDKLWWCLYHFKREGEQQKELCPLSRR